MTFQSTGSAAITTTLLLMFQIIPAQWKQSNGPWGSNVLDIAVCGDRFFVTTRAGLFSTDLSEATWSEELLPEKISTPFTIAEHKGILYMGGNGSSAAEYDYVYASDNSGASWTVFDSIGSGCCGIWDLSAYGNYLYVSPEDCGTYLLDMISKEQLRANTPLECWGIDNFTETDAGLLAVVSATSLCRSGDGGASWEIVQPDSERYTVLLQCGDALITGGTFGIRRSTNGGNTWDNVVLPDVDSTRVLSMAVSGSACVASIVSEGVFRSTDAGRTWNPIDADIGRISNFAVRGNSIIATGKGIYLSTDAGEHWSAFNSGVYNTSIKALHVSGDTILAGTSSSTIYRSTDNGENWNPVYESNDLNEWIFSIIAFGDARFATMFGNGILRSLDKGETWALANKGLTNTEVKSLAIAGGNIFVGSHDGIFVSSDNGDSWEKTADLKVEIIGVHNNVLIADGPSGFYQSSDLGGSWLKPGKDPGNVNAILSTGEAVFLATYTGIYRATNDCSDLNLVMPDPNNGIINLFAANGIIFAASDWRGSVFFSTDNGFTWKTADNVSPLPSMCANMNANDKSIFVGTDYHGIWRQSVDELVSVKRSSLNNHSADRRALSVYTNGAVSTISFSVPNAVAVQLKVYDIAGKSVATITDGNLSSGIHTVSWNTGRLPSGFYTMRLITDKTVQSCRILVAK